ncbi:hypothetical protein CANMA_005338 [Candida margitis]|uniref:uncharacterized protein n=1 Tax=Candida margitis TaxID=1775924 RepID=UPI0022262404|nr:uncharacterized protein CANMA_005338 [Candida margitis]KAI5950410.1 hypothetical protein CANMA_005338 [Candida margitis]
MKFNKFLASLASLSLLSQTLAAPAKRDDGDDDDVVVVTLQTTVSDVHTNTHIVNAPTSTYINYIVSASTKTVTHYTATVTSTIWGTAHTYTTVATTPISAADVSPVSENEVQTSTNGQQQQQQKTATQSSDDTSTSSSSPGQVASSSAETTGAQSSSASTSQQSVAVGSGSASSTQLVQPSSSQLVTETDSVSDGPTITGTAVPSSTDSWIIENVTTVTSSGVCYVNYDYYYDTETDAEETVTSTSTIFTTVTLN